VALAFWVAVDRMADHHRRVVTLAVPAHLHRNDRPASKTTLASWREPSSPAA
jgi:hypothetical protein